MTTSRRSFITGLVSLVAAPAIVRAGSLMPVKVMSPSELNDIVRRMMVDMAEPSVLSMFDWEAVTADLFRIMSVPPEWIRR